MPSFSDRIASRFAPKYRQRGVDYFSRGAVEVFELAGGVARAAVWGTRQYGVELRGFGRPKSFRGMCTCPAWTEEFQCKHVWATVLEVDAIKAEGEGEQDGPEAEIGVGDEDAGRLVSYLLDRYQEIGGQPATLAADAEPGDWRRRLAWVGADLAAGEREDADPPPIIEFEVEPISWTPGLAMSLRVFARAWRKRSRDHGERRQKPVRLSDLERLPAAERQLLALYDRELNSDRYYHERRTLSIQAPWHVSTALAGAVFPLLGRAQHVARQNGRAVRIDVDEPYEFVVRGDGGQGEGERGKGKGVRQFVGVLRRKDTDEDELQLTAFVDASEDHGWTDDDRVVRVEFGGGRDLAVELASGPLRIPEEEAPEVVGVLARLPGSEHFLQDELDRLPRAEPIGVVAFRLPKDPRADVPADVVFDYDGTIVDGRDRSAPIVVESLQGGGPVRRDPEREREIEERARATGLRPAERGNKPYVCARADLPAIVDALLAADLRVLAEGQPLRSFVEGENRVGSAIDWFELSGEARFDGRSASLPELLRGTITPEGFVELGDGSYGVLPVTWTRWIESLRAVGATEEDEVVRLPSAQALVLDSLLAQPPDGKLQLDRKVTALRRRLARFTSVEPVAAPKGFEGSLRPYQEVGLGWLAFLRDCGLGGCLADDMGLGKTVQVLAHLLRITRGKGRSRRPSLLVAPRSVLTNWLAEAERFAPGLRVLDFGDPDRWETVGHLLEKNDVVATTYALLRRDAPAFAEAEIRFDTVILDEAQAIKNPTSLTAKAARTLAADHRLALTGTPVENHLGELWSLFEFLEPGMLGRSKRFRDLLSPRSSNANGLGDHREWLQRALRPVLLRRTKAEVLDDLPDKIEQTLWCKMEKGQRRRYDELREYYRTQLLDEQDSLDQKQRFVVLEGLLRLRQAACHEGLLQTGKKGRKTTPASAKFDTILPRLETLTDEGHKVLVFSQFTTLLDLLATELDAREITFERLDGRTRKRQERIDRFRTDPDVPVFLISLKAGGFGLNLTEADYVFLLDPWWNPAVETQAIDRVHRIGQKNTVHAYRVACRDTVEEHVLKLQETKRELFEAVLGRERSLLQDLTREDLDVLLG